MTTLPLRDAGMGIAVAAICGMEFVVAKGAITGFPPTLLMALRFAITAFALIWFVPMPRTNWPRLAAISVIGAAIQYSLTFSGLKGLDAGLAAMIVQLEVPFLILLGALILGERPIYVKPFVKSQKNDSADAEAIAEAASRPTMRFVAVKGIEQQAAGMAFRTRDLFIRKKPQTINPLRGHLAEYGVIAPAGAADFGRLVEVVHRQDSGLPTEVIELARMLVHQIVGRQHRMDTLDREIRQREPEDSVASRRMTVPGIGPICASAMMALAPPAESFARGRDDPKATHAGRCGACE